jgi:hypothetical protein
MRFAATRRGRRGTIIVPHPNLSAKAVPPVVAVLLGLSKKSTRVDGGPQKGMDPGTLDHFLLQTGRFWGYRSGGHNDDDGPLAAGHDAAEVV